MKTKLISFFALLAVFTLVSCAKVTDGSSSSDSNSALDLASLKVSEGILVPSFTASTFNYALIVPLSTTSITITPVTANKYAGLGISPGKTVPLNGDFTQVWITVSEPITASTKVDSSLKTQLYTVNITRQ
jgi:hypothetical protein